MEDKSYHLSFQEALRARAYVHFKRWEKINGRYDLDAETIQAVSHTCDLADDETIIAIYDNAPGDLRQSIIITSAGLHIFRDGWRLLAWSDIRDHDHTFDDGTDKHTVKHFTLRLHSGEEVDIPILGERIREDGRKIRDFWGVYTFIGQIIAAYRKRHPS